jgi:hypothetical protein
MTIQKNEFRPWGQPKAIPAHFPIAQQPTTVALNRDAPVGKIREATSAVRSGRHFRLRPI